MPATSGWCDCWPGPFTAGSALPRSPSPRTCPQGHGAARAGTRWDPSGRPGARHYTAAAAAAASSIDRHWPPAPPCPPCAPQNDYIGLGVLLLDMLVGAHGFVKDAAITSQLGVSGKVANRALRFLQAEGLLASGARLVPAPESGACTCAVQ